MASTQTYREMRKKETEEHVAEFINCKNSFAYFCPRYIFLEIPGGDVLMNPYGPQNTLIKKIENEHYIIVLKSRQIGISTIIKAYVAWLVTFFSNSVIGIVSKDGKEATDFARDVMSMIDKLPKWMKSKFVKRTEQSFILKNKSKCYAATVNPKAPQKTLRGKAVTFMIVDEAAHIEYIDEAWTGMVSSLSTNQMQARKNGVPYGTIVLSTPYKTTGVGEWYYKRYQSAVTGDDILKPFTIHWKEIKELAEDPQWYKMQCDLHGNDQRKIQQELELKFLSTGGSFFDDITCQKLQENTVKPANKLRLFNGELWIFKKAIPGSFYLIGVDTAPEHGQDKSAITVFDYETMDQVAEYHTKCPIMDFVKVVKVLSAQYPGLLIIESTGGYGNQVVEMMNESEESVNMYKEKRGKILIPGLTTTGKTRPLMIDALYSSVTEFPEIVKSERLVLELIGLEEKHKQRVEASTGNHDDLAMAMAMCMYVRKYDPPLQIMMNKSTGMQATFSEIMDLNDIGPTNISNAGIMKHVRDKVAGTTAYVDIMDLIYNSK